MMLNDGKGLQRYTFIAQLELYEVTKVLHLYHKKNKKIQLCYQKFDLKSYPVRNTTSWFHTCTLPVTHNANLVTVGTASDTREHV